MLTKQIITLQPDGYGGIIAVETTVPLYQLGHAALGVMAGLLMSKPYRYAALGTYFAYQNFQFYTKNEPVEQTFRDLSWFFVGFLVTRAFKEKG